MNLNYCLRRACTLYPNAIAIRDGARATTYRETGRRIHQSASALRNLGLQKGDRVATLLLNTPEYYELYYSTLVSGTVIVPLNTRWNVRDIAFSISDSGSRVLVVDRKFAPLVPEIQILAPALETILIAGSGESDDGMLPYNALVDAADPEQHAWDDPREDDLAGLFYTSGTTGGPKGVMLSHRNLYTNTLHAMYVLGLGPGAVWLHSAPMFHIADISNLHSLSMLGAENVFLPTFDAEETLRLIERHRVTNLVLVPTMINMVVNHPNFAKYDLSSLRRVLYGASPMPLPLLEKAMSMFPCSFTQGYGMTEASPLITALEWQDHKLENTDRKFAPVKSAGRPVMGVEVRVVDDNDLDVAPGVCGEVIARGDNVMQGYWNRPDANKEVLRGGWLHTGDLGTMDDEGFIYILDRKKDMVKPGGENVYTPEIESAIMGHPEILEIAIIGIPHEKWGETIRAVATRREGAGVTEEQLIAWCRDRLTHFKCPTSVVFVEALPKGGTGKIQKNVLRERP